MSKFLKILCFQSMNDFGVVWGCPFSQKILNSNLLLERVVQGVGSAVNKLNDQIGMVAAVRSIADSLGLPAVVSSPSETAVAQ